MRIDRAQPLCITIKRSRTIVAKTIYRGANLLASRNGRWPLESIREQPCAGLDEPAGVICKVLAVVGQPLQILGRPVARHRHGVRSVRVPLSLDAYSAARLASDWIRSSQCRFATWIS